MGLEVIRKVMRKQGITSDMLSGMCGLPKSTIDKILSGATDNPGYKSVLRMTQALGISMDSFGPGAEHSGDDPSERMLLSAFRSMNEDGRQLALRLIGDMCDSGHYKDRKR